MYYVRIPDDDLVYRHAVYPLAFSNQRIVQAKFFHFQVDAAAQRIVGSLAWDKYLPTTDRIHSYGCRLAERRNKKLEEKNKLKRKTRQVYCGVYAIDARAVRCLTGIVELPEVVAADVRHKIEEDLAHVELNITLAAGVVDSESAKTAIIDRLWNASRGPLRHTCAVDKDVRDHPSLWLDRRPNTDCIRTCNYFRRL